jgi:hypothetical protein
LESEPISIEEYLTTLAVSLGLPPGEVDITALLDLARDAAHGIARPSAPLTTFLVGLAAGRAGGTPQDVAAAIATAHTTLETL